MNVQNFRTVTFSNELSMSLVANVLVLLLSLVIGAQDSRAKLHSPPTTETLSTVLIAHFRAIERNSHKGAMSYFHGQSPGLINIEEELKLTMSGYLQTIGTFSFTDVELQGNYAVLQATHNFTIITGVKFISRSVNTIYRFKKEEGLWKIWSKQEL